MNDEQIQGFFESMAGQFQAGRQIIEPLKGKKDTHYLWLESNNATLRDIDSFCVEAARWFGKDFNEKDFREIAFAE